MDYALRVMPTVGGSVAQLACRHQHANKNSTGTAAGDLGSADKFPHNRRSLAGVRLLGPGYAARPRLPRGWRATMLQACSVRGGALAGTAAALAAIYIEGLLAGIASAASRCRMRVLCSLIEHPFPYECRTCTAQSLWLSAQPLVGSVGARPRGGDGRVTDDLQPRQQRVSCYSAHERT